MNTDQHGKDEYTQKKLDEKQAAIVKHQQTLLNASIWRSCINCINWQQGPPNAPLNRCDYHKATPPANIIVHGCRDWECDIPF